MKALLMWKVIVGIAVIAMGAAACGAEATPTPQATEAPQTSLATPTSGPSGYFLVATPTSTATPLPTPTPAVLPTSPATPTPAPVPAAPVPPTVVTVELVDFAFHPAAISLVQGKDHVILLKSFGQSPHTFTIARNKDRTGAVSGLAVDVPLQPGESKTVQILVPQEAGSFFFYCRFHWPEGMVGTVQVAAGQSTPSTPAPAPTPQPPPPTPTPGSSYNY